MSIEEREAKQTFRYWPISFRLVFPFGGWKQTGWHGWPGGWNPETSVTLLSWTLHLGPLKILFGDDAPARGWLWSVVTRLLVGRCEHPRMRADLLEGDAMPSSARRREGDNPKTGVGVRWCPDCGAVQIVRDRGYYQLEAGELRTPTRQGGQG